MASQPDEHDQKKPSRRREATTILLEKRLTVIAKREGCYREGMTLNNLVATLLEKHLKDDQASGEFTEFARQRGQTPKEFLELVRYLLE